MAGVTVVDDYGHHPTEIAAVIAAARAANPGRVVLAFQPHRYTRTRALLDEFAATLAEADEVVLTDIYPASEDPIAGVTVEALASAVNAHRVAPVHVVPRVADVAAAVAALARPGDLVLTMGAGSIGGVATGRRGGADGAVRAQGGGVAMPPVAAPADKRFRRAHVKPSGKRRSRLRGAWIAARVVVGLTMVAYAAWRGAALVATAGSLSVANLAVFGNQRLSTGEVLSLLDGLRGRHILGIDLGEWQQRLQSSAWVEEATLAPRPAGDD